MIVYLAAGFSIMNVPGREAELAEKFGRWPRLISYWHTIEQKPGKKVFTNISDLKKERSDED